MHDLLDPSLADSLYADFMVSLEPVPNEPPIVANDLTRTLQPGGSYRIVLDDYVFDDITHDANIAWTIVSITAKQLVTYSTDPSTRTVTFTAGRPWKRIEPVLPAYVCSHQHT